MAIFQGVSMLRRSPVLAMAKAPVCLSGCHTAALCQNDESQDHEICRVCSAKDSSIKTFKGFPKFEMVSPIESAK